MNSHLELLPCPLCEFEGEMRGVKVTDQDFHIHKYGELYAGKKRSSWKICGQCGFVHQNPRPSKQALDNFYQTNSYHEEIPPSWRERNNYLNFSRWYYQEKINWACQKSGLERGRVFDIGFGHGGVLALFAQASWQTSGVEPDAELFEFASALGVSGIERGLLDSRTSLEHPVDLVWSNHTLEHVADLDELMAGLKRVLRPGGYVMTVVPTYYKNRSVQSRQWMNSAHYSMFTHHSLNQLFARHGLSEIAHSYRGWWKEIDDLWHLARWDDGAAEPQCYYEDPKRVARYLEFWNPLHSRLSSLIFRNYPARVARATQQKQRASRLLSRALQSLAVLKK